MKAKFFDVHAHVNFPDFEKDREAVFARAHEAGVLIANVGVDLPSSRAAVSLARANEFAYAIAGFHPTHVAGESFDAPAYQELFADTKTVAIGECGLDYVRLGENSKENQKKAFIEQIECANTLQKPLMLHIRGAYRDAYEILKTHAKVSANVHFFAGSWDEAKLFLDLGYTLSFTGVITFARTYDDVIQHMPLERILSETDCPFVAPEPFRGKRNEPSYVAHVVQKIADIRGTDYELVRQTLLSNALKFFGIKLE